MPANYLIAGMARFSKKVLPMEGLCENSRLMRFVPHHILRLLIQFLLAMGR